MTAARFARERYATLRSLVGEPMMGSLWRDVLAREAAGTFAFDPDRPGTPVAYGDIVMVGLAAR